MHRWAKQRVARVWWATACVLCTGLVLTASPALASPTSALTVSASIERASSGGLQQAPSASSSPSPSPASSSAPSGGWLPSFLDSCTSASQECLQAATASELRALRSLVAVGLGLVIALLAALLVLQVGRR